MNSRCIFEKIENRDFWTELLHNSTGKSWTGRGGEPRKSAKIAINGVYV